MASKEIFRRHDRAALVARTVLGILPTIRTDDNALEQLLREEFADEHRMAAADRELVDA